MIRQDMGFYLVISQNQQKYLRKDKSQRKLGKDKTFVLYLEKDKSI
jgi:hypothetical protein